ncbi:MAG TPA: protease inhibitor I42 family protein [Nitrospiraceae bacterium]|nr:protease inhibitor I42 family protein [Nitrospiraceae bacterium]
MNTSGPDNNPAADSNNCRVMATAVDRPFVIHLWEDRTRGEQWIPSYDARALALLSDEFLRIASNNAVENGQRTFEFKAVTPGVHHLVFEKRMGWKFTAEDRRVFRVEAGNQSGS